MYVQAIICIIFLYTGTSAANEVDRLIFFHIPKTGGTTVTFLLNQQFDPSLICVDDFYYQVEGKTIKDLEDFQFFRGHFFFNSNLGYLENAKKIVILRDPVQRIVSEQKFFRRFYIGRESDLYKEHFLQPGEPIDTISNQMCLFLSSFDRNDTAITPEMHLASAKNNLLNEFFFVGITERLEVSLRGLYKLMGWQIPQNIPRIGSLEVNLENITSQILEEIKQRNLLDIELYEFAKELCNSKLHQLGICEDR